MCHACGINHFEEDEIDYDELEDEATRAETTEQTH